MIEQGCHVGFFGLGRSNLSLLRTLHLENCSITLRSDGNIDPDFLPGSRIMCSALACEDVSEDILFLSPSVKRERFKNSGGVILSSDYELFLEENNASLFAVTGSDGKSSTARLVSLLLREAGHKAAEVGNMGIPMYESLGASNIYVAELSSFMLSAATPTAKVAALTSLSENHLDWHGSYENYKKTKIDLLKASEKYVISDENDEIKGAYGIVSMQKSLFELMQDYPAELYLTVDGGYILKNGKKILPLDRVLRREEHNIKNLMLAIAMSDGYCESDEIMRVASSFSGLAHRCEKFLSNGGVDYYDSSIDTSPSRTATTLRSLNRKLVIILGGKSKGLDYSSMLDALRDHATAAVLVGENKYEILSVIADALPCYIAEDFAEAADLGIKLARNVGALLLSPASASYDMFASYEARGICFKKLVRKGITDEENLSRQQRDD